MIGKHRGALLMSGIFKCFVTGQGNLSDTSEMLRRKTQIGGLDGAAFYERPCFAMAMTAAVLVDVAALVLYEVIQVAAGPGKDLPEVCLGYLRDVGCDLGRRPAQTGADHGKKW